MWGPEYVISLSNAVVYASMWDVGYPSVLSKLYCIPGYVISLRSVTMVVHPWMCDLPSSTTIVLYTQICDIPD